MHAVLLVCDQDRPYRILVRRRREHRRQPGGRRVGTDLPRRPPQMRPTRGADGGPGAPAARTAGRQHEIDPRHGKSAQRPEPRSPLEVEGLAPHPSTVRHTTPLFRLFRVSPHRHKPIGYTPVHMFDPKGTGVRGDQATDVTEPRGAGRGGAARGSGALLGADTGEGMRQVTKRGVLGGRGRGGLPCGTDTGEGMWQVTGRGVVGGRGRGGLPCGTDTGEGTRQVTKRGVVGGRGRGGLLCGRTAASGVVGRDGRRVLGCGEARPGGPGRNCDGARVSRGRWVLGPLCRLRPSSRRVRGGRCVRRWRRRGGVGRGRWGRPC